MFVAVRRPLASLTVSGVVSKATITMADVLAKLPDVEIDPEGTFKYILLRVNVKDGDANKDIVRGTKSAEYHSKWIGMEDARSASLLREREMCKPRSARPAIRLLSARPAITAAFGQIHQHATNAICLI